MFILFFLLLFSSISPVMAEGEVITINKAQYSAVPVAVNDFQAFSGADALLCDKIVEVINNDLKLSGAIKPIKRATFIENKTGIRNRPLFAAWKQISANFLVNGQVERIGREIKVSFILWDVLLQKDLGGFAFQMPDRLWRRAAHKVSDQVYEKITGQTGYFDTKIAYAAQFGTYLDRRTKIALMDWDGANHEYLTAGDAFVTTPILSPKSDKLLYVSYKQKVPKIYIKDLRSKKEKVLSNLPGMSFAPRFSPDGNCIIFSIARGGSTHLYEMNVHNGEYRQITHGNSINTSPSYSPDGKHIIFTSDRSGGGQLYVATRDGGNLRRISFGQGSYLGPCFSPKGDYVVFTKVSSEIGFGLGIMKLDEDIQASGERILATGYLIENAYWAPNGRTIIFSRQEPPVGSRVHSKLYMIDVSGHHEREVNTPDNASSPYWSQPLEAMGM
ncbi:Tol-Pal system protein TolB [Rickettsiales endosymbiont of Paramecium tredecaurelia]|uniref:Tol-Pal system beta propeller repeat protein TolB n=1 Tax=Candidatus Sarmatiella mevalonica TaxID=2770581 RepID=UPI001923D5EA|nr:Tol-Pal system beta propeller repeat protein TolB [Candidatus Sarmatiella mevalonica]MBL3284816.1 Tol-Pal system protein TolB [Candidatus Sarmatiella mevalonica]